MIVNFAKVRFELYRTRGQHTSAILLDLTFLDYQRIDNYSSINDYFRSGISVDTSPMFRFFGCLLLCWALLGLNGLFRDIKIFGPVSGLVQHIP